MAGMYDGEDLDWVCRGGFICVVIATFFQRRRVQEQEKTVAERVEVLPPLTGCGFMCISSLTQKPRWGCGTSAWVGGIAPHHQVEWWN